MKWFKHDTDCLRNRKIRKIIRTHGAIGYAIWFALLEKLYESEGDFQVLADEMWLEDLADDLKISDYRTLIRVFDTFADVGLISSQLWQGEHILYCEAIAERGDAYMEKRVKETQRKRNQRAKKKALSLGDKKGTRGQMPNVPPADVRDQISDLDQETSYLNSHSLTTASEPERESHNQTSLAVNAIQSSVARFERGFSKPVYPWTGDRHFVDYLLTQWEGKDGKPPRSRAEAFILNQETSGNFAKLEIYWRNYQEETHKGATGIKLQLNAELKRLNMPAVLPEAWQAKTGSIFTKELSDAHAAEYLAYLQSQGV